MTNDTAVILSSLPQCPITVEIRQEPCKSLEPGQKHSRAAGVAHYRFLGTAEQFDEWCDTPAGAMNIHHLWVMHEQLFVTFSDGETVEIA